MNFGRSKSVTTTHHEQAATTPHSMADVLAGKGPVSIIELVNACLEEAHELRASDIHIDPAENNVAVRLRIDGLLHNRCTFSKTILVEVISRIKVLSHLRTDEHQAAQDGRFRFTTESRDTIDIRVSIAPTYYGENAILRLLTDRSSQFSLDRLGFSSNDQQRIIQAINQPHGMILATGPTGSGKTTTLYTLIKLLNTAETSIITIEDPIEYAIAGVTQIQINPRSNLTFANGLRSILRQDPNIIMVGEIRDNETASIAVNTALTGHLLLSTLHTNDASTTLPRLLDMGIDAYLVASTVSIAIGQRLVRQICKQCRRSYKLTPAEQNNLVHDHRRRLTDHQLKITTVFKGDGCRACEGTGFAGRIGIYEVLVVSPAVREAILNRAPGSAIKDIAITEGMTTMFEDGLKKVATGQTSLTEILRTTAE